VEDAPSSWQKSSECTGTQVQPSGILIGIFDIKPSRRFIENRANCPKFFGRVTGGTEHQHVSVQMKKKASKKCVLSSI